MEYSLEKFEQDIQRIQPRFFDTYILPGFMIWYAVTSKQGKGRWTRRMLFTSGIYMLYRNYSEIKKGIIKLSENMQTNIKGISEQKNNENV